MEETLGLGHGRSEIAALSLRLRLTLVFICTAMQKSLACHSCRLPGHVTFRGSRTSFFFMCERRLPPDGCPPICHFRALRPPLGALLFFCGASPHRSSTRYLAVKNCNPHSRADTEPEWNPCVPGLSSYRAISASLPFFKKGVPVLPENLLLSFYLFFFPRTKYIFFFLSQATSVEEKLFSRFRFLFLPVTDIDLILSRFFLYRAYLHNFKKYYIHFFKSA